MDVASGSTRVDVSARAGTDRPIDVRGDRPYHASRVDPAAAPPTFSSRTRIYPAWMTAAPPRRRGAGRRLRDPSGRPAGPASARVETPVAGGAGHGWRSGGPEPQPTAGQPEPARILERAGDEGRQSATTDLRRLRPGPDADGCRWRTTVDSGRSALDQDRDGDADTDDAGNVGEHGDAGRDPPGPRWAVKGSRVDPGRRGRQDDADADADADAQNEERHEQEP